MNFSILGQKICGEEIPKFFLFDLSTAPPLLFYSYIPIVIFSLSISIFIFIKDKRSLQSKALLVFSLFFVLWVVNILIQWVASYHAVLMFGWQLTAFFEVGMYVAAIYFSYAFIFKRDITFFSKLILALIIMAVAILTPTGLNIFSYDVANCEGILGSMWNLIYIFEPLTICWIGYLGFRKINDIIDSEEKKKVLIFSFGMCIFLSVFFLSNFYGELTRIYEFNLWGPLGMLIFLSLLMYMMVKFNIFNVRLFSTQVLMVSLIGLIFSLFFVKDEGIFYTIIAVTLFMAIIFGTLLIRSVNREILQRQHIEFLAKDLTKANTRLLELDKQKSEFVSFATHQLRAPLTAMRGYASLILEGELGNITSETKQAIGRIYDSSTTLASIVDDYLNISRIELGTMKYTFNVIDLKDMVEHVIGELKPNIEEKGLKFTFTTTPISPNTRFMIHADKDKLKQVIANLIDNSVKYTPTGSVKVSLEKNTDNRKVLFSIKDTGVGISHEVMPKLFTKFVRAENANKQNIYGTGLGLYVAKDIVEAHKGRLWAESEGEGKGSTFFLELDMEV
jgi:signal transduction histidine kinase